MNTTPVSATPEQQSPRGSGVNAPEFAVLHNPAWHALRGPHAKFARGDEHALAYPGEVTGFIGVRDWSDPKTWPAIATLLGPDAAFIVNGDLPPADALPSGWEQVWRGQAVQLVESERLVGRPDSEVIELGAADIPDILALVDRNKPGPFAPRTHELGRYIGVRVDGRLIAMAGERLRPTGWSEISAVSTDPGFRRRGLASRLILDLVHSIRSRGDRAMMHAAVENVSAVGIYQRLGFELRRHLEFASFRTPASRT